MILLCPCQLSLVFQLEQILYGPHYLCSHDLAVQVSLLSWLPLTNTFSVHTQIHQIEKVLRNVVADSENVQTQQDVFLRKIEFCHLTHDDIS